NVDRAGPAVVGRHEAALEPIEPGRTRRDAQAFGQRAPAFTVVALPFPDHIPARPADDLCDGAGVIDITRRPAGLEQLDHECARRRVVTNHFVDERLAVARAVFV